MSAQHPAAAETGPVRHRKGLKLGSNPPGQERLPHRAEPNPDRGKGRPSYPESVFYERCIIYGQNEGHRELWRRLRHLPVVLAHNSPVSSYTKPG